MRYEVAGIDSLPELAALRGTVGWGPGTDFGVLVAAGRAMLVCARDDSGAMVASGVGTAYGSLGFVGSMITVPELQGRGIGRHIFGELMAWFATMGCSRVELEATEAGRPLYERHFGFVPRWDSMRASVADGQQFEPDPAVELVTREQQWQTLLALDREAIGGDREILLRAHGSSETAVLMVLPGEAGTLAYGLRRGGSLGPVIGRAPEAAARVVRTLGAIAPEEGMSCGTGGHPGTPAFWEGLGFTLAPYDLRMTWGAAPDDRPEMLFGLLSGGLG